MYGLYMFFLQAGVQQRLSEQEHSFLVMKADLLRAGFKQQTLENNKVCIYIKRKGLVLFQIMALSYRDGSLGLVSTYRGHFTEIL